MKAQKRCREPDCHEQLAAEQAALHQSKLALARWCSGHTYAEMQIAKALRATAQADWYEAAQRNFQEWLAAGGFACAEKESHPNENSGNDAAVLMPHGGAQCEESKFSLVRIRDAVE